MPWGSGCTRRRHGCALSWARKPGAASASPPSGRREPPMDLDTMLTEAAPARHLPLDGPDSPAAVDLYQRITAQPPAPSPPSRRRRLAVPALIGLAAAAAAAVTLALIPGSPAAHSGGRDGVTLAAWSVVKEPH